MTVLLFCTDPDFRALLTFTLRHHGFRVAQLAPDALLALTSGAANGTVLLVDLAASVVPRAVGPRLAQWAALYPCLALTTPATMGQAHSLLPAARAYLPVPLQPESLVRQVRRLLGDDAEDVRGYGARLHPVG